MEKEKLKRFEIIPKYQGDETTYQDEDGEVRPKGWRNFAFLKNPMIKVLGMAFREETVERKLAFANDAKMRIAAPLSIPIVAPRKAIEKTEGDEGFNDGLPFEVEFTEEGIEKFLVDFMSNPDNLKELFNKDHDNAQKVPAYLLEIWIVDDPKRDRSFSTFGIEVPKGTVFVVAQFTDREYYDKLVEEDAVGLSVEGIFGLQELKMNSEEVQNYADVIVINSDGDALFLHRKEDDEFEPNKWGFAGGKIEEGEEPIEAAKREALEETGFELENLQEVEAITNPDGSTSFYFVAYREDVIPCIPSEEHDESEYKTEEEIKKLPVIMEQNERFLLLVAQAKEILNNSEMKIEEGKEFEIDGKMFIVKDGKPIPVDAETEVEAGEEKPAEEEKDKPAEKPAEEEIEAEDAPAPAEAMTAEKVAEIVKPMIDEAMKAVVDAIGGSAVVEDEEQEMQYSEEEVNKKNKVSALEGFSNFMAKKK